MERSTQILLAKWEAAAEASCPDADDFAKNWLPHFQGFHLSLSCKDDRIVCDSVGPDLADLFDHLKPGVEFVQGYPATVRPIHYDLLLAGFASRLSIYRLARYWFGHRFRELEWLFVPVYTASRKVQLVGGAVPLSAHVDPRDSLDLTRNGTERLIEHSYIAGGDGRASLSLKPLTWSYLTASRTAVHLNGKAVAPEKQGIGGLAVSKAREASRPSVLVVGAFADHEAVLNVMSRHYRIRKSESISDAKNIMRDDRIDVVIAESHLPDGDGNQLFHFGSEQNTRFGGGVLVSDWEDQKDDIREEGPSGLTFSLIRPVGEYALRRAVEEIAIYIRRDLNGSVSTGFKG